MSDLEKSIKTLILFLDEKFGKIGLKKQLKKLKSYDFSLLGQEQGCHEDSTDIVKAIYFILWHDKLPKMSTLKEMDENYSGETINTFNTLFQQELNGINKFISKDENPEFYKQVNDFKKMYLTIGNFMLLPNKKIDNLSINQKKGSCQSRYKDYFDLFAVALFHTNEFDELKEENRFYFSIINEEKFYKINFLEDYVENNQFKIKFKHDEYYGNYYPYYHWKYSNAKMHQKEYVDFAIDYIDNVEKIIKHRSDKISSIIEEIVSK